MRHTLQRFRLVSCLPLWLVMVQCQDDAASSDDLGAHSGHAQRGDAGFRDSDSDADVHGDSSATADAGSEPPAQSGPGAAGAESAPPPDDGKPTWSGIFNHTFRSCKNPICHGQGLAGIDMTTQQAAYDSLVGHASDPTRPCATLGLKRVEPGKPDESLLWLKLDINAPCGQQMPPGGSLPQEVRDRVRDWIAQGAKND